jgi:hypothetical protein
MRANEPEGLNAFESRLAAWRPVSDGLDADRLMFAAGRASVRGRLAWPTAAVSLALMSLCLGQRLLWERAEHWTDRVAMQGRIDLLTQSIAPQLPAPQASASSNLPDVETATYRARDLNLTDNVTQVTSTSMEVIPDPKPLHVWQLDQALER